MPMPMLMPTHALPYDYAQYSKPQRHTGAPHTPCLMTMPSIANRKDTPVPGTTRALPYDYAQYRCPGL